VERWLAFVVGVQSTAAMQYSVNKN
jgi:hypothetical protein